ncbi:MAG: hypothetical protein KGI00_02595 [Candidatus Micrarchaeota archaeon]|nr:hypothetical protein [Candidatus Micrarchaeota archaeon]
MIKLQSAMEYLMTYGWAILAIAIVMVSLYSLGIFSLGNLKPTATPGSCQVIRTAAQVSLAGQCNNMIPKYVGQFNGQNAYVDLGNSASVSPEAGANGKMTLCIWYFITSSASYNGPLLKGESSPSSGNGWEYAIDPQGASHDAVVWVPAGSGIMSVNSGKATTLQTWYFVCFTYDYAANQGAYYYNGTQYSTTLSQGNGPAAQRTGHLVIGAGEGPGGGTGYSNIYAADVQIYNTSLDNTTIKRLYQEGIGGAPVDLQHLVGWWPLNGNANDYSGNNNQGTSTSVVWNANWQSGYTAPTS